MSEGLLPGVYDPFRGEWVARPSRILLATRQEAGDVRTSLHDPGPESTECLWD